MTQPAPHLVAHHRTSHRRGSPQSRPGPARRSPTAPAGARTPAPAGAAAAPTTARTPPGAASAPLREASAVTTPAPLARAASGPAGQTLTRARPLRRRAARIARPARVRMRSRNPCVFARRRLFGWNVRLLTGTPGTQGQGRHSGTSVTGMHRPVQAMRQPARATGPMNGTRTGWPLVKPARRPAQCRAAAASCRLAIRSRLPLPLTLAVCQTCAGTGTLGCG